MKAGRSIGLIAVLLVIGAGATAAYYAKAHQAQPALPGEPAPYNSIMIGTSEQEVVAKIGQPISKSQNSRYEAKSADQWRDIAEKADALESRSSDPYGTVSPEDHAKLVDLRRTLEHRIRDSWSYPAPKPQDAQVVFEFDDRGTLLAAGVHGRPHTGPVPGAATKPSK